MWVGGGLVGAAGRGRQRVPQDMIEVEVEHLLLLEVKLAHGS